MPVESQYAPDVRELLQSLRERDGWRPDGPAEAVDATPGQASRGGRRRHNSGGAVWSEDDYDAFIGANKQSYRRVHAVCDVLANAPGQLLTTSRASAEAEVAPSELRAALGKFSVWMGATIGERHWPFGWSYGQDVDPDSPAEFHYSMGEQQAAAWKAARQRRG